MTGWRAATERALYGQRGFYLRPQGPAGHFRTSVHASALFAGGVAELLRRVDEALGRPGELALVDVGAGHGELAAGVLDAVPGLAGRLRVHVVERAERPPGLDPRVEWTNRLPEPGVTGLVVANEWLDNVPVDVAQADDAGRVRAVLVGADGAERLGEPVAGADARWLARWWPLEGRPGLRAEIGWPRDEAWAAVVGSLRRGLAVAVDYAHQRNARPPFGTLTGFRAGHQVPPVPDGSCDITAHVAIDACGAAGRAAGAVHTLLTSQRAALHALGLSGGRPPLELARTDPSGYLRALAGASEVAELTDPHGLGSFAWLVQGVGMPVPLAASTRAR